MKTLTLHTTCYQPMLERVWAGISVFNNSIKDYNSSGYSEVA